MTGRTNSLNSKIISIDTVRRFTSGSWDISGGAGTTKTLTLNLTNMTPKKIYALLWSTSEGIRTLGGTPTLSLSNGVASPFLNNIVLSSVTLLGGNQCLCLFMPNKDNTTLTVKYPKASNSSASSLIYAIYQYGG